MTTDALNVLFLCTANAARGQMAEALLNGMGGGKLHGFSAGSAPVGFVQPLALDLIAGAGYPTYGLRSKSWKEFTAPEAPIMDMVITVCDTAAGEAWPAWPGQPAVVHWSIPDPKVVSDDPAGYKNAWLMLRRRIELLLALPLDKLDRLAREQHLREIGAAAE